ncbi:PDR/VanB family oxidoreductase [Diaphorobacter ruginosibacter]|uniref:PDR/VanB family oxidoreductase n=1 Tax=Diaphorobacter ruginosibacter TaxID=1715720 RepID=UPI00333E3BB9
MPDTSTIAHEKLTLRVQSITYAAKDTYLVELVDPDCRPLPAVTPGAHIDLHLGNGITRSYSLVQSGDTPASYVVGVKLDAKSRGGSRYVHEQLRVGSLLPVSMPRNHFPLHEDAAHTVLIAGGIGITPIWCMAQRLQAIAASWELWYSVRSRADLAFVPLLQAMGARVHLHVDEEVGGIIDLPAIVAAAPEGTHFYCCGPTPMLDAYEAAAAVRFPAQQIHLERFAAKQAASVDGGFVISLARSCRDLVVPQGASVLKVLLDNGIEVDSSCQEGICGCCEVVVLEGEVDHRDAILTEAERAANKTMMVCCSGAKCSRLVLDL